MNEKTRVDVLHLLRAIAQKYQGSMRLLATIPQDFDEIWDKIENEETKETQETKEKQ